MIIVDVVLDCVNGKNEKKTAMDPNFTGLAYDLIMLSQSSGGKERTEEEWKKIVFEAGFGRYNIISIPALPTVIEVFPKWALQQEWNKAQSEWSFWQGLNQDIIK